MGLDGVLGGAVEGFDTQVLLHPFEEQFDLPAAAIELCDGVCGEGEGVGEEDQSLACFRVGEFDPVEFIGVVFGGITPPDSPRSACAASDTS